MLITRQSPISGKENTLDLDVSQDQLNYYYYNNTPIQKVFPQLTPEEREFIKTGITKQVYLDVDMLATIEALREQYKDDGICIADANTLNKKFKFN